MKNDDDP